MQISKLLLMAAFGLITSAFSANAQFTISAVPYTITAPGTYVLSSNLTSFVPGAAITINSRTAGRIILDLGGFTLQLNPNNGPGYTGIAIQANPTASNITVRNGTVGNFHIGIDVNPSANGWLSNVHIDGMTFIGDVMACVQFQQVNSSSITNCTFDFGGFYDILDGGSQGGNTYSDDFFSGPFYFGGAAISVSPANNATLEHMHFGAP
jgi:hypothetical protein